MGVLAGVAADGAAGVGTAGPAAGAVAVAVGDAVVATAAGACAEATLASASIPRPAAMSLVFTLVMSPLYARWTIPERRARRRPFCGFYSSGRQSLKHWNRQINIGQAKAAAPHSTIEGPATQAYQAATPAGMTGYRGDHD